MESSLSSLPFFFPFCFPFHLLLFCRSPGREWRGIDGKLLRGCCFMCTLSRFGQESFQQMKKNQTNHTHRHRHRHTDTQTHAHTHLQRPSFPQLPLTQTNLHERGAGALLRKHRQILDCHLSWQKMQQVSETQQSKAKPCLPSSSLFLILPRCQRTSSCTKTRETRCAAPVLPTNEASELALFKSNWFKLLHANTSTTTHST